MTSASHLPAQTAALPVTPPAAGPRWRLRLAERHAADVGPPVLAGHLA